MGSGWQIVAFPVILPWRQEFWTLPLYFPHLKVGVIPGWPPELPYRGLPLPPEAVARAQELKDYKPGDLRHWQAFQEYQQAQEEESDLLRAIRSYGQEPAPLQPEALPNAWSLVWQLEKMQADQEAQLLLVDQGQEWLQEILAPEPWAEPATFGPVPGVEETVDPELARLRYLLWERVMAPYFQEPWAPFLLGRTSRALFLTLKGWPGWTGLKTVEVSLPGCRSPGEWLAVQRQSVAEQWPEKFGELLTACLKAPGFPELKAAAQDLTAFVEETVAPEWPAPLTWSWDLEIWAPDLSAAGQRPVLCWRGAGAGILPG